MVIEGRPHEVFIVKSWSAHRGIIKVDEISGCTNWKRDNLAGLFRRDYMPMNRIYALIPRENKPQIEVIFIRFIPFLNM